MVVPTAVSPYLWHPTPTAMAMATLAELAPGRAAIAVGVGNPLFLQESGRELTKPVRAVREFLDCLRALWGGEPVHYPGEFFRLAGARMAFRPGVPIPIYVAAMGPDMLRLAGRLADGVVLSAGLSADFVKRSLALCREGAEKAGRDPGALRKAGYLYFAVSRNGEDAFQALREKLAFLFRNKFLSENIKQSGIPIDQEAIIAAVARRDLAAAARLVPDEAVEAFTVGGAPKECVERFRAFVDAGLEEVVLALVGRPEEKGLALEMVRELAEMGRGGSRLTS
jgi:5,10-methylenetetrahydromethanopterin reductase